MAKRRRPRRKALLLVVPEDVLARLAAEENLPGDDDDAEAGFALRIEEATREIAAALVETGRPLRHLHDLRLAIDALACRRGHVEGVRAAAAIVNGCARDLHAGGRACPPA